MPSLLPVAPSDPEVTHAPLNSGSTTWTATTGGDFNTASNWSNGVPVAGVDAYIEQASTDPITVTLTGATDTADAVVTQFAGLALKNSTLTLQGVSSETNINTGTATALTQAGGLLDFQNGPSGNETSIIASSAGAVIQSSGTIEIDAGTLEIIGNSVFAGTLTGAQPLTTGTLSLQGASTYSFKSGVSLTVNTLLLGGSATMILGTNIAYGGFFTATSGGTLNLEKYTISLSGGTALTYTDFIGSKGKIANSGSLVAGGGVVIGGSNVLANTGTLVMTGNMQLGDSAAATLTNSANGVIALESNLSLLTGSNTSSSLTNNGTIETIGTNFAATIDAAVTNAGLITVAAQTTLNVGNSFSDTGTISGAGTFQLTGGGVDTITAASVINVGEFALNVYNDNVVLNIESAAITAGTLALEQGGLVNLGVNLSYAGDFIAGSNAALLTIDLGGNTLSLSGPTSFAANNFGNIELAGPGTVALTGATSVTLNGFILGQGAVLTNAGVLTDTAIVQLGDANGTSASITNSAAGTWDVTASGGLSTGPNASSTFTNAGLFENTGSNDTAVVAAVFDSTGTVLDQSAGTTLALRDGGTLSGTLAGAGEIDFANGAVYNIAGSTALSVGALGIYNSATNVVLTGADAYAGALTLGNGATLTLATTKTALTLTGADTLSGTLLGSGAVVAGSGASLVTDGLTIGGSVSLTDDKAVLAQSAYLTLGNNAGSTASLQIDAKSIYELTGNATIASFGVGAISNAGTFEKLQGTGVSTVSPLFTNTGTVSTTSGTLAFAANFTNNKLAEVSNGSSLSFAAALSATGGSAGTISLLSGGLASFGGYVGSAETLKFADSSTATATLGDAPAFAGTIAGFGGANELHLLSFVDSTASFSGGVLQLTGSMAGSLATADLTFTGNYTLGNFTIESDNAGGTVILFAGSHG